LAYTLYKGVEKMKGKTIFMAIILCLFSSTLFSQQLNQIIESPEIAEKVIMNLNEIHSAYRKFPDLMEEIGRFFVYYKNQMTEIDPDMNGLFNYFNEMCQLEIPVELKEFFIENGYGRNGFEQFFMIDNMCGYLTYEEFFKGILDDDLISIINFEDDRYYYYTETEKQRHLNNFLEIKNIFNEQDIIIVKNNIEGYKHFLRMNFFNPYMRTRPDG
jgi:hypothetical protein